MSTAHRLDPDDIAPVSDKAAPENGASVLTVGEHTVLLSDHGRSVFEDFLLTLLAGTPVDVTPVNEMVSTQEAADNLHVSRPTVIKMLDDGILPYERPATHRRIPRAAVERHLATMTARRSEALDTFVNSMYAEGPDEFVSTR